MIGILQTENRAPVTAVSLPNVVDCLAITGMEEEEPLLGLSPKETNTEPGDRYARHSGPILTSLFGGVMCLEAPVGQR